VIRIFSAPFDSLAVRPVLWIFLIADGIGS